MPLDPAAGSEMRKTRPCVVVSRDAMNARLRQPAHLHTRPGQHHCGLSKVQAGGDLRVRQCRISSREAALKVFDQINVEPTDTEQRSSVETSHAM